MTSCPPSVCLGLPLVRYHAHSTAPRAPPASPAAGWIYILSNGPLAEKAAVSNTIQCDTARHAKILHSGFFFDRPAQPQHYFFGHFLNGPCEIHLPLRKRRFRLAGRPSEQLVETVIGHPETRTLVEVPHVQMEGSIRFQVNQIIRDRLDVNRSSLGRKAHNLIFAGIDLEAGVVGEG